MLKPKVDSKIFDAYLGCIIVHVALSTFKLGRIFEAR